MYTEARAGGPIEGVGLPDVAGATPVASSYVDLYRMQAWLISDGRVVRGPVPVRAGGPGSETPIGRFTVLWKDPLHISRECHGTPMPHSVFFTTGGVAFHHGNMARPSAGCLKLAELDARVWFDTLQVGDEIRVHGSARPAERACRTGLPPDAVAPPGAAAAPGAGAGPAQPAAGTVPGPR